MGGRKATQSVYTGPLGPSKLCLPGKSRDGSGLRHFFVSTVATVRPPWPARVMTAVMAFGDALTLVDALSISGGDGGPECPPKSLQYRGFHAGGARPRPVRHSQ